MKNPAETQGRGWWSRDKKKSGRNLKNGGFMGYERIINR